MNKALLANPHYQPALYNLATLEASSNPLGAVTLYNQLLTLSPSNADALFNDGLLLIAHGSSTQGHSDISKAISINPAFAKRLPAGITP